MGRQSRSQPSGEQSSLLGEGFKEGSSAYDSANTTITARSISHKLSKTGGIDVIIVGAGLAGLIAADELTRAGLNVKVLEANDRVGGRTFDRRLEDGNAIEMGGQWIAPRQTEILQLIQQLGLDTHNTFDEGKSIYRSTDAKVKQYNEMIPCGILPWLDLFMATRKINSLSKSVGAKTPCQAKHARYSDQRSISTWIDDTMSTFEAKQLIRMAIKAVYAEDAESISFLDLLATVSGAGGSYRNDFQRPLPSGIIQYYRCQPMGSAIKLNVVYSSPFWRAAGLNGAMINADEKSAV
ncbi:hypothetical protein NDA18_000154 [Ustilago nuda]|nr:hypothetical protein NDA18_000154 [Ustilago nuda]